jgi:peptide/nickel transport system permease protein
MTTTEVPLPIPGDTAPRAGRPATGRRRRWSLAGHLVLFAAGIALLYAFLAPLGHLTGVVKVPVVLISLVVTFRGLSGTATALFGPRFDTGLWLCAIWLGLLVLAAALADLLPLGNYQNATGAIDTAGYATPDLFSRHPLGTNDFGLDLLARSIYGARESLLTCTVAAGVGLIIGCALGIPAAYYRGVLDRVVGVVADVLLSIPALLLLFALITIVGTAKTVPQAVLKVGGALAIIAIPVMTRLARANALPFIERDFILVGHALGRKDARIVVRDLLPNVLPSMLSFLLILVAQFIVAEGALAYLGLGLQPPAPSWGNMIAEGGLTTLSGYPFVPLVPGVFMLITVYSLNRVGQKLRAAQIGPT